MNRLAWLGSFWPFWSEALGRDPGRSDSSAPAPTPMFEAFGGGGHTVGNETTAGKPADAAAMRELRARAMEARLAQVQAPAADKKSN